MKDSAPDISVPEGLEGKEFVLTLRNFANPNSTVFLSDATADIELLRAATGVDIQDMTPSGTLCREKSIVQHPVDVTRGTSPKRARELTCGVLTSRPDCRKIGIITHSNRTAAIKSIDEPFRSRIARVSHFGSGSDRGSNEWLAAECDLLVVLGTPRVAEIEIKRTMLRCGWFDDLRKGGEWGEVTWQGTTTSGQPRVVRGRGYTSPRWAQAHRSKVCAGIVQAAGRARSLLETGCDCVVVSTEECGFPLADFEDDLRPLTGSEVRVLTGLSALSALVLISGQCACAASQDVADTCGIQRRQAQKLLAGLEQAGLVTRVGERGGWRLSDQGAALMADGPGEPGQ